MTTVIIADKVMPRAELRKKLDNTLAEACGDLLDQEAAPRSCVDDHWQMVHCEACRVDFPRPVIIPASPAGKGSPPTCPKCGVGKLTNGRYPWDKARVNDPEVDEKKRSLSVHPSGIRLPIREDPEDRERSPRGTSLPPRGKICLLYTSPSPRDKRQSRMPSSA